MDRRVHVQAKAARFWQRRSVRHTLESLPVLKGYQATIDVDD